jgi:hypothetical protein
VVEPEGQHLRKIKNDDDDVDGGKMNEASGYDKRVRNGHRVPNRFSSVSVLQLLTNNKVPAAIKKTPAQDHFAENL